MTRTSISLSIDTTSTTDVFAIREIDYSGEKAVVNILEKDEARKLALALLNWAENEAK